MEIKLIPNEDFMQLAELTVEMYQSIDKHIAPYQAVNTLIHFINNATGFRALGLYDENVLVGFVTGNALSDKIFYFSGIYIIVQNTEWVKTLIEKSFADIQEMGYIGWEADATNKNISSILEKYGATTKYTRYRKDFE